MCEAFSLITARRLTFRSRMSTANRSYECIYKADANGAAWRGRNFPSSEMSTRGFELDWKDWPSFYRWANPLHVLNVMGCYQSTHSVSVFIPRSWELGPTSGKANEINGNKPLRNVKFIVRYTVVFSGYTNKAWFDILIDLNWWHFEVLAF